MKLTTSESLSNVSTLEDLARYTSIFASQAGQILNANLNFSDNFSASTVTMVFPLANVTTSADHKLGRLPVGYLLVGSTVSLNLYDSDTPNTEKVIFLRSSVAGTARVLVF